MLQAQLEAPRTDALTPSSRPSAWRQRCVSRREAGTRAPPLLAAPLRRQQQVLRPGQRENTAERRAHREPAPPAPSPHPPSPPGRARSGLEEPGPRGSPRASRRALPRTRPARPGRRRPAPPRPLPLCSGGNGCRSRRRSQPAPRVLARPPARSLLLSPSFPLPSPPPSPRCHPSRRFPLPCPPCRWAPAPRRASPARSC